jgi:MFS family permease
MGTFVKVHNYAGFRLSAPPYNLSPTQISLIFVVYLFGMAASPLAGASADRLGRGPVLLGGIVVGAIGIGMTLSQNLGGGWLWAVGRWPAVAAFAIGLLALAFAAALHQTLQGLRAASRRVV